MFIFITKLSSIVSLDIPYLTPLSPLSTTGIKNYLFRIKRTKLNSTQFEKLNSLGAFKDLPENDQIGLF